MFAQKTIYLKSFNGEGATAFNIEIIIKRNYSILAQDLAAYGHDDELQLQDNQIQHLLFL